ncbi:MAG TPA: VWA domain-containing protein [Vicinamibacteria bacterium]|nr:VWA domain-containing protein [Vicinamibacteria bacterium]
MREIVRTGTGLCFLVVAGGLCLEGMVARAQTPAPPEFPSEIALITVDAVVVDATGQSVDGLTRDDFAVEEDGQRQDIVNFQAVSVPPESNEVKAPAPSAIATSAAPALEPRRAFAILVDDLRLPGEETLQIRRVLAGLVGKSLRPGDAVTLGTTSGEAWWTARMPEGRDDLLAVAGRVQGKFVDPSTREHMTEFEAFTITRREAGSPPHAGVLEALRHPSTVSERVAVRLWDRGLCGTKEPVPLYEPCFPVLKQMAAEIDGARSRRTSLTLRAIGRAVGALAPFHGRTSLVFLSPGFLQDEDLAARDIASAALQARTSLYFVDTRGLVTGAPGAAVSADLSSLENPSGQTQRRLEERLESGGAEALAEETGGFSVRQTNDLAAATERIAAESRTFYLLGIRPLAGKADAWRRLRVRVNRSGLTARARRGYRLDAATAAAALDVSTVRVVVPLRLASYVLDPLPRDRTRVVAAIEIDTSGLGTGPEESRAPLQLRLEATPRDGGETVIQDVSLQSAPAGGGVRTGSRWRSARLELELPAGVHGIRAVVRDPSTGRTGFAEQRIVVPESAAFRVSTLVLSDQVTASPDANAPISPAPVAHDELGSEPGRPILAAFEVFGAARDPATGRPNVETRFALEDGGGRRLAASPASPLTPSSDGRLQQTVALPPLPGGPHDLVITVEDRVAGQRREVRRRFVVAGPAAVASAAPAPSRAEETTAIPPELASILERAARFVVAYGQEFSDLVAEDECQQVFEPNSPTRRKVRNTRGSAFFITLPGPLPWATFHDVWEVDGSPVRDREERLGRLFRESPGDARERARTILEESARYNLGPVRRSVNIPTLALLFFHPDNQRRFAFELKGKKSQAGVVEVAFRERGRPTLVAGDTSEGAPVRGRAWIDAEHGTVMKTDAEYDIDPRDQYHRSRARIVTEYRPDPRLGILVPDRMKETYTSLAAGAADMRVLPSAHARSEDVIENSGVLTVEATTRYSAYRRFEVSTGETYTPPKKPQ